MRDPSREKHGRAGMLQISRLIPEAAEIVTRMVERHNDHNNAPQYVYGINSFR